MPQIQCEAVLFDMDGTILDSSIPVTRQWRLWAESVGIPFEQVTQTALIPVAYTKGTDFKAGARKPLDPVLHVNRW